MNLSERVNNFHSRIRLEKVAQQQKEKEIARSKYNNFLAQEKQERERAMEEIKTILDDPDRELDIPKVYRVILSDTFMKYGLPYDQYSYIVFMTERIRKVAEAIQHYNCYVDEDKPYRHTTHFCDSLIEDIINGCDLKKDFYYPYNKFKKVEFVLCDITKCSLYELDVLKAYQEEFDTANKLIEMIYNSPEKELSKKCRISIIVDSVEEGIGSGFGKRVYEIPTTAKGAELLRVFKYMRACTRIEPMELPDKVAKSVKRFINGLSR